MSRQGLYPATDTYMDWYQSKRQWNLKLRFGSRSTELAEAETVGAAKAEFTVMDAVFDVAETLSLSEITAYTESEPTAEALKEYVEPVCPETWILFKYHLYV